MFKLSQFRENGEFIDVLLRVDESIFPAHRSVLAANSDYFHAMFTSGMKESNQEVIELKDETLSALGLKVVMVPSTVENSLSTRKTCLKFSQLPTIFRCKLLFDSVVISWTRSTFKAILTSRRIFIFLDLLIYMV